MNDRTTSENQFRTLTGMPRWLSWMVASALLLMFIALTVNVWLLSEQLQRISQSDQQQDFWTLCHSGTTVSARTESFLRLAASGNTEWRSANLSELSLDSVDLAGLNLQRAALTSGSFQKANFTEADLTSASLDLSDFTKTVFAKCRMRNATLFKTRLNEADFRNADLLSASLEQSVAHKASFVAAKMGDAFLAMADLSGANFTGADLTGANLEAAVLNSADLALANFHMATLTDTDLTDTNWWRSRGFTSLQLDEFTLLFPPSPNAPESRRRDFEIWLTRRIEEHPAAKP
ncbi:MAG: pentapeptide repeat-containing protein [Planctomycetaceae bacterium]